MSISKVTDTFAFVLENGEFTESILYSEDEIEQLKPEEKRAIDVVLKHVEASYVALLSECRRAFSDLARTTPLDANRATLQLNQSRSNTLWKRGMTHIPLLIQRSWVAWVSFGLWATSEAGRPIKLGAHIGTQARVFQELEEALRARGAALNAIANAHAVEGILPKEGQTFRELGDEIAKRALPIASDLYVRLASKGQAAGH